MTINGYFKKIELDINVLKSVITVHLTKANRHENKKLLANDSEQSYELKFATRQEAKEWRRNNID
jgi:hypothetical protein